MRPLCLLLASLVLACPASAQDDTVARLRARLSAAPGDVALQCQLSFALVGAADHEEARTIATAAVAAIPRPLTRATRRLAGACLYNLGRAEEGLGHRREAVIAYARSLAVRDNDAVRERIHTLVPQASPDAPFTAVATTVLAEGESCESAVASTTVRVGTDVFHFVPLTATVRFGYTLVVLAVVVVREDQVAVARVESWRHEEQGIGGTIESVGTWTSPSAHASGARAVFEASGGGACGRMDGFMDFEHRATVLASFDGVRVHAVALVTQQSDCEGRISMGVSIRGDQLTVRRSHHGALEPGTYPITTLLR